MFFNPFEEDSIVEFWQEKGFFRYTRDKTKKTFTMILPPPNITGKLHIGHALNVILQDVVCRHQMLQGKNVLWQPGTDHAGIATQMVIEKELSQKVSSGQKIEREEFLNIANKWKDEKIKEITKQLEKMGVLLSWNRDSFSLEKRFNKIVNKVFVSLYKKGLIYKGFYMVNWDCKLRTAISDLEVEKRKISGKMYDIVYILAEQPEQAIVVSTTRPETLFGDVAIAVFPCDERYKDFIGKNVFVPLCGRTIPIIEDKSIDASFGTGAVKITPGHDFNDFEIGKRNDLPVLNILDEKGFLTGEHVPIKYRGLDRFEARASVIRDLEKLGFLKKIEKIEHSVPYGDRSSTVIEPRLTRQWILDTPQMSKLALDFLKIHRKPVFLPRNWEKVYTRWLSNIHPWCISRQLWWGHQIPAWINPQDGKIFVEETEEKAYQEATEFYKKDVLHLVQDKDVLDTWFSSSLWAFSSLGWGTREFLEEHYPSDILFTGFDILFFWVARMVMMGIYFTQQVPFQKVYLHALIRDKLGRKMSKTRGNSLDPVLLVKKYGADALRFTLVILSIQGRDILLDENRLEGYRNFITKIKNLAKFCELQNIFEISKEKTFIKTINFSLNHWFIKRLGSVKKKIFHCLENYMFNIAAESIYEFIWDYFCDHFLEFSKTVFKFLEKTKKEETKIIMNLGFFSMLKMLHPVTPFISEFLWKRYNNNSILETTYDFIQLPSIEEDKYNKIEDLIACIKKIRSVKNYFGLLNNKKTKISLVKKGYFSPDENLFLTVHTRSLIVDDQKTFQNRIKIIINTVEIFLDLSLVDDLEGKINQIRNKMTELQNLIIKQKEKLRDKNFLSNAPEEVIFKRKIFLKNKIAERDSLKLLYSELLF